MATVHCGHIWVSFKLANRNTNYWSKVSCFKTSRLGPYIKIHPTHRWRKPYGAEAQLSLTAAQQLCTIRSEGNNEYCVHLKQPVAWTRLIINLNRNNSTNSLDKVLLQRGQNPDITSHPKDRWKKIFLYLEVWKTIIFTFSTVLTFTMNTKHISWNQSSYAFP